MCEAVGLRLREREFEIEPAGEHLWLWFWSMNEGRQAGLNGPLPLSATEMAAWAAWTGTLIEPEERTILRDMDRAFMETARMIGDGKVKASSNQPLTPELFDAVFG